MRLSIHQQTTVTIFAKQRWNDTGVEVENGETYLLEAAGKWRDLVITTDADGYSNWYMWLFNRFKRFKQAKWFTLIGCINKSGDFIIGKTTKKNFKESGKLYCYANDGWCFYSNNFGSLELTITRK